MMLAEIALAAPALLRPRFTVELNVQASETSREDLIGDITHELKALGDVDMTTGGTALWILSINVVPIMDKKGLQGYAISTVIADQNASQTLQKLPPEDFQNAGGRGKPSRLLL